MAALSDTPLHTASRASTSSSYSPFIEEPDQEDVPNLPDEAEVMTRSQVLNLYTSHFLSTWNVRTYEFAAVIFTAAAYPNTLIATSVRGIVRNLASICFSSAVGRSIDQSPDRFRTLINTISLNRSSVIMASAFWFIMLLPQNADASLTKHFQFLAILALGIIEGLSGKANMLCMERDWVPALRAPDGEAYDLTHLNAVMRRIDLVCKLVAPILISAIISLTSVSTGAVVVGVMSLLCWGFEYFCARKVWRGNASLRVPKPVGDLNEHVVPAQSTIQGIRTAFRRYIIDFRNYFSSAVCIPSISLSLLHLSALSYGAVFVTFLLNAGFSLEIITIARAAGSIVEISSTVVTPVGVQYLSKAHNHGRSQDRDENGEYSIGLLEQHQQSQIPDSPTETGLERLGLWGLSWQLINLVPVLLAIWSLSPTTGADDPISAPLLTRILFPGSHNQIFLALTLFTFLSISRLGLWIYDLTTQQLTQTKVPPTQRSSFTGVEYSLISLFELTQLAIAILFHRPDQFRWLALMSFAAVATSTLAYAGWVRSVRGHLVHWERVGKSCKCVGGRSVWRG